jgi:hypothetical protein
MTFNGLFFSILIIVKNIYLIKMPGKFYFFRQTHTIFPY